MEQDRGQVMSPRAVTPQLDIQEMCQGLEGTVEVAFNASARYDIFSEQVEKKSRRGEEDVLHDELFVIPQEGVRQAVRKHEEDGERDEPAQQPEQLGWRLDGGIL